MRKNLLIVLTFMMCLGGSVAQTFSVNVNPFPANSKLELNAADTLKVLAVMVNFQEDKDNTTFGTGKFGTIYSDNYGKDILDPLPHDKSYFEAHLEFVKNYFRKVSNGNLNISYSVLPDTFSVSKTMRSYSPPPKSDDYSLLGDFATEVWSKAGALFPGFHFSDYDVFIIFHAGVGRDISLPGSLGTEKDLPSIYMGQNLFKKIYGNNFDGIPVGSGNFKIKNSLIMPETESREVESFGGTILFEISINGLLVASVASHLGLPDLFDTNTGLSAIGRFGLMDGQAIFAYGGTYPPEPSPWEKIYLGWAAPTVVSPDEYKNLTLTTNLVASISDTVILKIPINSSEYYLVENRSRDALSNGSVVTFIVGLDTLTKTFTKDTTGYYSFSVDSLSGVVIDVDEFDWAVPGSGIVIWHIDEAIINNNLTSNSINNDKNNHGVDVEEADGIQDIGEEFYTIFGDIVIGEGFAEDLWYKSNPANLFKNKFDKNTRPNTNSNSGANSLISISAFSEIGNRMSFNLVYGDSIIKPIFAANINMPVNSAELTALQKDNKVTFAIINNENLHLLNDSGIITTSLINFSANHPSAIFWNNTEYFIGAKSSTLNVYMADGAVNYQASVELPAKITTPPVVRIRPTEDREILVGTDKGAIHFYSTGRLPAVDPSQTRPPVVIDTNLVIRKIAVDGLFYCGVADFVISSGRVIPSINYFDSDNYTYQIEGEAPVDIALTKDRNGKYISILLTSRNNFYLISEGKLVSKFTAQGSNISSFALGDVKQDGENYIIYNSENKLYAVNLQGALAENFPFEDPLDELFTSTPLVADFEGDEKAEIIAATKDGRVFAIFGGSGKIVPGFPITLGTELASVPVTFVKDKQLSYAALNSKGDFYGYKFGASEGTVFWGGENGGSTNLSFVPAASSQSYVNEFFPKNRAYNYPNPVYDAVTYIRYYVNENSKINIKIFDLAGDFVAELNADAAGGLDNETKWDVSTIQSGVYFARIEAAGSSGKTETNIIKIAVVK